MFDRTLFLRGTSRALVLGFLASHGVNELQAAPSPLDTDQTFTKVASSPTTLYTGLGMAWGDVTNDGFPDLFVVPNTFPQGGHLFLNQGNGTFNPQQAGAIGSIGSGSGAT